MHMSTARIYLSQSFSLTKLPFKGNASGSDEIVLISTGLGENIFICSDSLVHYGSQLESFIAADEQVQYVADMVNNSGAVYVSSYEVKEYIRQNCTRILDKD